MWRLHRQTVNPCHHPPLSSLLPRICLVGRTMAPTQLQAAPTPAKIRWQQGQITKQAIVLDFVFWDDMVVIFLRTRLPKGRQKNRKTQKNNSNVLWSHNAVGHKVRASRPAGKFLARSARKRRCRDHLGELHHVLVWAIICNKKKAPRTNQ